MPANLAVSIDPSKVWLLENFKEETEMLDSKLKFPTTSLFNERILKMSAPELQTFYLDANKSVGMDSKLPILLLSQAARCREAESSDRILSQAELRYAVNARIAFRVSLSILKAYSCQ